MNRDMQHSSEVMELRYNTQLKISISSQILISSYIVKDCL